MTSTIITLPIDALIDRLDHGKRWITGWGDWRTPEGATCLHGAIRFCQPVPGDAQIIERVGARFGFGIADNDNASGWNEIETMIREHAEITDEMLAKVYGPQWAAVIALVRRAAILTDPEWRALADAYAAAAAYAAACAAAAQTQTQTQTQLQTQLQRIRSLRSCSRSRRRSCSRRQTYTQYGCAGSPPARSLRGI